MHQLTELNNLITEFYDKMSSWEMSVVKETGYSLAQIHTLEVLGSHGAMRMKELANIQVTLTEEGKGVFQQHNALHMSLTEELTRRFSAEQQKNLAQMLTLINQEF